MSFPRTLSRASHHQKNTPLMARFPSAAVIEGESNDPENRSASVCLTRREARSSFPVNSVCLMVRFSARYYGWNLQSCASRHLRHLGNGSRPNRTHQPDFSGSRSREAELKSNLSFSNPACGPHLVPWHFPPIDGCSGSTHIQEVSQCHDRRTLVVSAHHGYLT